MEDFIYNLCHEQRILTPRQGTRQPNLQLMIELLENRGYCCTLVKFRTRAKYLQAFYLKRFVIIPLKAGYSLIIKATQ